MLMLLDNLKGALFTVSIQDTFAYAIHHVATVLLVLLSGHAGLTRLGGVIMYFFDWADPLMLVAKAVQYFYVAILVHTRVPTNMPVLQYARQRRSVRSLLRWC